MCAKLLQLCLTFCDSMDYSPPGFSSVGFSRQEHWNGLPFPSPGDLPNPGIEPRSLALRADSLLSHQGSPNIRTYVMLDQHIHTCKGYVLTKRTMVKAEYQDVNFINISI